MFRKDGKKFIFTYGIYKTNIKEDIEHFVKEIESGNEYVRHALPAEIEKYEFLVDPKASMEKNLRPQIEAEVRNELEVQMRAALAERAQAGQVQLTQDQIDLLFEKNNPLAGVSPVDTSKKVEIPGATLTFQKLGGITGTNKLPSAPSGR
jgi:hypothetical protein